MVRHGLDSSATGYLQIMYSYEYANETSVWMKSGNFSTTWETLGFAKRAMLNGVNS